MQSNTKVGLIWQIIKLLIIIIIIILKILIIL